VDEGEVDNESVDVELVEDPSSHLDEFLEQIRVKVIKEFNLDEKKWSSLLAEFVLKAIHTVKSSSFTFKDSIDITEYVKIQLVQYKDTSKSKYLNGVVIKKSIAHKRMKWEIDNPRILLLSKSLGILKDEEDFMDLESEIK
jgi:T-complex protein 1 subunit gamma